MGGASSDGGEVTPVTEAGCAVSQMPEVRKPPPCPEPAALWKSQEHTKPAVADACPGMLGFPAVSAAGLCWAAPGIPGPREVAGARVPGVGWGGPQAHLEVSGPPGTLM